MYKRSIWLLRLLPVIAAIICLSAGSVIAADKTTDNRQTSAQKTASKDVSGTVTQSYSADSSVQIGMVVQLKDKDTSTVVPLDPDKIRNMLGIVIPTNKASIVLTPEKTTKQQVLVATNGHFNVLASNQGGPIKAGDFLTISSLPGIAMKASEDQQQVVGRATADFSGSSNVIGTVDVKDMAGHKQSVAIGRVAIDIDIAHNPLFQKTVDYVPGFLAKIAVTAANKPVSVARIYLSTGILLVISIITGNMLYSGVKNGMKAVGRNPLSKKSIMRSLIQTIVAGLIVFIAGVFGVYLLLKL